MIRLPNTISSRFDMSPGGSVSPNASRHRARDRRQVRGLGLLPVTAGGARDTAAPHSSSAFQLYSAKALASWYPRSDLEIEMTRNTRSTRNARSTERPWVAGAMGLAGGGLASAAVSAGEIEP